MKNWEFLNVYVQCKTTPAFRHGFINIFRTRTSKHHTTLYLFIKSDEMHPGIIFDGTIKSRDVKYVVSMTYNDVMPVEINAAFPSRNNGNETRVRFDNPA